MSSGARGRRWKACITRSWSASSMPTPDFSGGVQGAPENVSEDMASEVKLRFLANRALPKLAWLADVDRGTLETRLVHGPGVEVLEHGVIEGVWDGPFADAAFDRTPCVFGSGAVARGRSIIFVP